MAISHPAGERGVHLGTGAAAAGGGEGSFPASQFPLLTSLPEFATHRDINRLLRPPVAAVSTGGLPLHCGCWVGLGLQDFPFSPSP